MPCSKHCHSTLATGTSTKICARNCKTDKIIYDSNYSMWKSTHVDFLSTRFCLLRGLLSFFSIQSARRGLPYEIKGQICNLLNLAPELFSQKVDELNSAGKRIAILRFTDRLVRIIGMRTNNLDSP